MEKAKQEKQVYEMTYQECKDALKKHIASLGGRYNSWDVFSDFCECAALSIANAVDKRMETREKREKRYLDVVAKYDKEDVNRLAEMLALVAQGLTQKLGDFLGETLMELKQGNKHTGQFFTPYSVAQACAMTIMNKDHVLEIIKKKGYISIHEPSCGGGGMIVAALDALRDIDVNYQRQAYVEANDLDPRCAHMTYVVLSLLGVPAIVRVQNTLSLEIFDTFYTPMYVLHGWHFRRALNRCEQAQEQEGGETVQDATTEDSSVVRKEDAEESQKPVAEPPPEENPPKECPYTQEPPKVVEEAAILQQPNTGKAVQGEFDLNF